ncbi:MAG: hypothetical protein ACXVJT_04365 [Thermoanaerobaculia bacterium]
MKRLLLAALLLIPVEARALNIDNLLSVIAMPLAVAAVSDVTGVPTNELSDFVATLNNANVPPVQFVSLLRYVPVALVQDSTQQQPVFVDYVQTQASQGITGSELVALIIDRLRTYDIQPQVVTVYVPAPAPAPVYTPAPPPQQQVIYVDRSYIPPAVQTRVEYIRAHPHEGPPGQLKKMRGLQTGAEIVHGDKKDRVVQQQPVVVQQQPVVVVQQPSKKDRGHEGGLPPGLARKGEAPPMMSGAPPQGEPPGQAKKKGGVPPGQAKKEGGDKEHGHEHD